MTAVIEPRPKELQKLPGRWAHVCSFKPWIGPRQELLPTEAHTLDQSFHSLRIQGAFERHQRKKLDFALNSMAL